MIQRFKPGFFPGKIIQQRIKHCKKENYESQVNNPVQLFHQNRINFLNGYEAIMSTGSDFEYYAHDGFSISFIHSKI
jgi:hypothetical protein